jgi:hypothetical protein
MFASGTDDSGFAMYKAALTLLSVFVASMVTDRTCAVAQVPFAAPKCADHQALFQGLRDARMRLLRGVIRGNGHRVLRTDTNGALEGDVSFFCAFDYIKNRVRCDRNEPNVFVDADTQSPSVKTFGYQIVQSEEKTLYLDLGGGLGTTNILSIAAPGFRPPRYGNPIDVRTFGLADWGSFDAGATFEKTSDVLDRCKVVDSREEPDGRCVVTILPLDNAKIELWINTDRGYTVERSEMRTMDEQTREWSKVLMFADIGWSERDGVWVPESINLERLFNGRETYYAKLEWESVNVEPDAKLFEPQGLGLDPAAIIVDDRLGDKPVVIGPVYDGGRPPAAPARLRVNGQSGPKLLWLAVGNAVALFLVGACYFWRRRRQRSPDSASR